MSTARLLRIENRLGLMVLNEVCLFVPLMETFVVLVHVYNSSFTLITTGPDNDSYVVFLVTVSLLWRTFCEKYATRLLLVVHVVH